MRLDHRDRLPKLTDRKEALQQQLPMNALAMTSAPTRRNHWRRRLLLSAGALILLLAVGIPGCSWYQDYRFNQLLSQWRAMGEPDDIASWLASQPCDLELARAWQEWRDAPAVQALLQRNGIIENSIAGINDEWFPTDLPAAPELGDAAVEATLRPGMELLHRSALDLSISTSYHLAREQDPALDLPAYEAVGYDAIEEMSAYRHLAAYLSYRSAMTSADRWLDLHDSLVTAYQASDTLLDLLNSVNVAEARDRSYLRRMRDNSLDRQRLQGWIDGWKPLTTELSGMIRRYHCCTHIPIARQLKASGNTMGFALTLAVWWNQLQATFTGNRTSFRFMAAGPTVEEAIEEEDLLAQYLQGTIERPLLQGTTIDSWVDTVRFHDHRSRAIRLAALALLSMHEEGRLPNTLDHPAAAKLCDLQLPAQAVPQLPAQAVMRYRLNDPRSFTITVDTAAGDGRRDLGALSDDGLTFDLDPRQARPSQPSDGRRGRRGPATNESPE